MKNLSHSKWRLSVMVLAALIGSYIAIFVVLRELSTTFVIGSIIVFILVVVLNAIYVFNKRMKSNGTGDENDNHG